jgi:RNA polymerase sigma-B factor
VRVSRRASDLLSSLGQAVEQLSQTLSRAPTIPELARFLHVTEEEVLAARDAHEAYRMEPLNDSGASGGPASVGGVDDAGLDSTRLTLRSAITSLGEDERRIVYLRFYEGLTQREIALRLGTNQVQVSRQLRRIFRRLESGLEPLAG